MIRALIIVLFLPTLISCGEKENSIRFVGDIATPPPEFNWSVRAESKRLVEQCYSQMGVDSFRVDTWRYFPEGGSFPKRYTIQKGDPLQIRLILKLGMRFENGESEAIQTELMERVNSCKTPIRELFARYSINMDLTIENATHPSNRLTPYDYSPVLSQEGDEATIDTMSWPGRNTTLCDSMAHEIGHYLGLFDEYSGRRFPNRWVSHERDPYSVMGRGGRLFNVDFYPRHIKTILEPVCPGLE